MLGLEILLLVLYGLCLLFVLAFSVAQWRLTRLARRAYVAAATAPAPPLPADARQWPRVTVQLPVYNELNVVERIIDAAAALDYPADRLQIQLLDDSTDESVALAATRVAYHRARGVDIEQVRRPDRQGYKAGALAHGLASATGELVAIFDADFVPAPDFLRLTVPYFLADAQLGVVQTRWGHLNEDYSLLTELQAFGLNAHFLVEQVGRNAGHHFINFNGTGGVWRRRCIEQAGGWQADTLTEDLDLSYRAQLGGWHFRYLPAVVAPAELPAQMDALRSQQHRWNKGGAETARKHLGRVWRSAALPLSTKLYATAHLLNSAVFVAVLLMGLLSVPLLLVQTTTPELSWVFRLAGLSVLSLTPLVAYYYAAWRWNGGRGATGRAFAPKLLLFLSISMGLSLHNGWAVLTGLAGRLTPFVRTPKSGLSTPGATARLRRYRTGSVNGQTVLEALLALYFAGGIYLAFRLHNYGLLPFHLLLTAGYAAVVYYSVRHARQP
ncbi:cellulose synthase family protein [Hymenobacter jeollabukensis]|uniref:Glycosyltransferase n=1 Tax=Hymenobacter jeollabukensis TaxID=2025313 RepID=A0A5R8WW22_9BACT|nr:cellulose synthase family protein [Hymenobacter jeollabukensis]TLM96727.1 glycosyltransferase [Hymenobacter jeollabukensis]